MLKQHKSDFFRVKWYKPGRTAEEGWTFRESSLAKRYMYIAYILVISARFLC